MNFRKIDAPSIKELFLTQIEEMILSGELKPDDRLPSERELADTMGISKTIVHEGIRELTRMGFLEVKSRKGVYVADYARTGNLDTLFAIIRYRGGMPDKKMLIDLLNVRIHLLRYSNVCLHPFYVPQDTVRAERKLYRSAHYECFFYCFYFSMDRLLRIYRTAKYL